MEKYYGLNIPTIFITPPPTKTTNNNKKKKKKRKTTNNNKEAMYTITLTHTQTQHTPHTNTTEQHI